MIMGKDWDLVVALDIGSTYSGYAWQWRQEFQESKGKVNFNTNWGSGAVKLYKTNTYLLMDKDQNVLEFGHAADKKFCRLCGEHDRAHMKENYRFFKDFKGILYNGEVTRNTQLEDTHHELLPLFVVMSKFIGALKNHFLKTMKDKDQAIQMDTTRWVVTVPAIWPESSKRFMRDATLECGIKSKNLLLALEPEAAALYCLQLPAEERKAMNNFGNPGDKFLSVDLGGFTTDLTALKVLDTGHLEELPGSMGDIAGGQNINDSFFQYCTEVFEGDEWFNTMSGENAKTLMKMENDFEQKKVEIGSDDNSNVFIDLEIPPKMRDKLQNGEIKLKTDANSKSRFKEDNGEFLFHSEFIRNELFGETVKMVIQSIDKVLKMHSSNGIRTLLLVGGFSESKFVVKKIREHISQKYPGKRVCVPSSPIQAVLHGAVLFGHDEFIFHSRIARATYGIKTNRHFDHKIHDASKKWKHEETGEYWCKDIFSAHVKRGESVLLKSRQPALEYVPAYKNQTSVEISIYSSTDKNPRYVTDEGCKKEVEFVVDMSDTTGGTKRKVLVTMIYGGTELEFEAENVRTREKVTGKIEFDMND